MSLLEVLIGAIILSVALMAVSEIMLGSGAAIAKQLRFFIVQ
jgi:hypothetical protein